MKALHPFVKFMISLEIIDSIQFMILYYSCHISWQMTTFKVEKVKKHIVSIGSLEPRQITDEVEA